MLIDAHTHLDRYDSEIDQVVEEIERHRIFTISTSMSIPSFEKNREIAAGSDLILPIFGVHPWNASGYSENLSELNPFMEQSPMFGEIGLDYYYVKDEHRYPAQRRVFKHFLEAAARQDKMVNIHTKGAERDVLDLLDRYSPRRVIVHWYSGPEDILAEMISRGCYFTVGVEILKSEAIRSIARIIPSDRLLTETDNPGGIKWLTGSVGMPAAIREVVDALAGARRTTPEAVEAAAHANLRALVSDDPWLPDRQRLLLGLK